MTPVTAEIILIEGEEVTKPVCLIKAIYVAHDSFVTSNSLVNSRLTASFRSVRRASNSRFKSWKTDGYHPDCLLHYVRMAVEVDC